MTIQAETTMSEWKKPSLLFLTPVIPALSGLGGAMRCGFSLQALSKEFRITLIAIPREYIEESQLDPIIVQLCESVKIFNVPKRGLTISRRIAGLSTHWRILSKCLYPNPWEFADKPAAFMDEVARSMSGRTFDAIHVFRLKAAPLARRILTRLARRPSRVVLDMDDIESKATRRLAEVQRARIGRLVYWTQRLEAFKYHLQEARAGRVFDVIVVCSTADRQELRQRLPHSHIERVPNVIGIPTASDSPAVGGQKSIFRLLFVGSLDYEPNQDGVCYFAEHILPRLKALALRPFMVQVVGRRAPATLQRLAQSHGFDLISDPPTVAPYYQAADVVIAPLLSGGGTRIKLLEAFAYGKPVVSTPIGAEGLETEHGTHLLLGDDPSAFALAICRLMDDQRLADTLIVNSRRLLEANFTPDAMHACYRTIYQPALAMSPCGGLPDGASRTGDMGRP